MSWYPSYPDYMLASFSKTTTAVRRQAAAAPRKPSAPIQKRAPSNNKVVPKKVTVASRKATQSQIQQALQVSVHINQAATGGSRATPRKTATATPQRKKAAASTTVAKRTQNSKQPVQVVVNIKQSAGRKKK